MKNIREKIKDKSVVVGIFGLGYVGLPLAFVFAKKGIKVIGFDIIQERVDALNEGHTYIKSLMTKEALKDFKSKKTFLATTDFAKYTPQIDAAIICVPTPLDKYHQPDLSYLISTLDPLSKYLKKGSAVSLESTTYPGTTEEVMNVKMKEAGFEIGKDLFMIYSPEREDPGNGKYNTFTIPKLVSGISESCLEIGKEIYELAIETVVPVSSTKIAEMAKLLENIHRCINISMINEMKIVCEKMGIDIWQVIEAAATKPFGFTPFYPGPGIGGHCIPVDPFYLTWKAKEFGIHANFIELAGEMNFKVQDYVVEKTIYALNSSSKGVRGSKILVIGIAYKKNISDTRESPSITIIEKLKNLGAVISWYDNFADDVNRFELGTRCIELGAKTLKQFDLTLILTNHDGIDYDLIEKESQLIVDTRGIYKKTNPKIIKA